MLSAGIPDPSISFYHSHVESFQARTRVATLGGRHAETWPRALLRFRVFRALLGRRLIRQITLVFPPGGSTDVAARIVAEKMRPILGRLVIIENVHYGCR
jgi:hypothetical protein